MIFKAPNFRFRRRSQFRTAAAPRRNLIRVVVSPRVVSWKRKRGKNGKGGTRQTDCSARRVYGARIDREKESTNDRPSRDARVENFVNYRNAGNRLGKIILVIYGSSRAGYLKILTVDIRTFPSRYVIKAGELRVSEYPDASAGRSSRGMMGRRISLSHKKIAYHSARGPLRSLGSRC